MMPMQARKSSEEETLLAMVLQEGGRGRCRQHGYDGGSVQVTKSSEEETLLAMVLQQPVARGPARERLAVWSGNARDKAQQRASDAKKPAGCMRISIISMISSMQQQQQHAGDAR